jgi:DNA-binding response OmpR family regulator
MEKECKVLVIDDDPYALDLFKTCFEEYQITTFFNPLEAFEEAILKDEYHFIFLDIYMPELDGIELCKRIRKSIHNKDSYIYAFTSEYRSKIQSLIFEAGFDDVMEKSISPEIMKKKMLADISREKRRNILPKTENRLVDLKNGFSLDSINLGLTKMEYKILRVLNEYRGIPLESREIGEVLVNSYSIFDQDPSTIRTHIKNIKEKFNKVIPNTEFIEKASNKGYFLIKDLFKTIS